jgi:hypothetical protein
MISVAIGRHALVSRWQQLDNICSTVIVNKFDHNVKDDARII